MGAWEGVVLDWMTSWEFLMLHPYFVVCFFVKSTDLSRFICCGRRMRTDLDEEKASKSGLSAMFTQNYQNVPFNESWP